MNPKLNPVATVKVMSERIRDAYLVYRSQIVYEYCTAHDKDLCKKTMLLTVYLKSTEAL